MPKGQDLSVLSQPQLDQIAMELNARPRKTLGWKGPAELFLLEGDFNFVQFWSQPQSNQPRCTWTLNPPSRISRQGNAHLRHALFMPALVGVRRDPAMRAFYQRLQQRHKAKMQALIAVA